MHALAERLLNSNDFLDWFLIGLILMIGILVGVQLLHTIGIIINSGWIREEGTITTTITSKQLEQADSWIMIKPLRNALFPLGFYNESLYQIDFALAGRNEQAFVTADIGQQLAVGDEVTIRYGTTRLTRRAIPLVIACDI